MRETYTSARTRHRSFSLARTHEATYRGKKRSKRSEHTYKKKEKKKTTSGKQYKKDERKRVKNRKAEGTQIINFKLAVI